jgi:hypothetical protein
MGLGDPLRFQFDPGSGRLLIGDAGGSLYQEVDEVGAPARNFGWPHYDGPTPFVPPPCLPVDSAALAVSAIAYPDTDASGSARVIGGPVYVPSCSGCDFPPEYAGNYFFADSRVGFVRRLQRNGAVWEAAAPAPGQPSSEDWARGFDSIADLLRGPDGALWYCIAGTGAGDGEVGRIAFIPPASAGDPETRAVRFRPPHPSPMRGFVELSYQIPRRSRVVLAVYDAAGRRVRRLVDERAQDPGWHSVRWDGRSPTGEELPAGIYVARLSVDGEALSHRVPLVR